MNAIVLKGSIYKKLESVEDPTVLQAFIDMMNTILKVYDGHIAGYDADGKPLTRERLESEVVAASERVKAGQYISHNDLKK